MGGGGEGTGFSAEIGIKEIRVHEVKMIQNFIRNCATMCVRACVCVLSLKEKMYDKQKTSNTSLF